MQAQARNRTLNSLIFIVILISGAARVCMDDELRYEWDEAKSHANEKKHGLGFDAAIRFEWPYAIGLETQFIDGEVRQVWLGPIGNALFALTFTQHAEKIRVISLRRATRHEKIKWRVEFQR